MLNDNGDSFLDPKPSSNIFCAYWILAYPTERSQYLFSNILTQFCLLFLELMSRLSAEFEVHLEEEATLIHAQSDPNGSHFNFSSICDSECVGK